MSFMFTSFSNCQWRTYFDNEGTKCNFFRFKGNRFNVVFVLAKLVYYHHKRIKTFLTTVFGAGNLLLVAILKDIQNPVYIESCHVLAMISDLKTAPFWRVVESCNHVLSLNVH